MKTQTVESRITAALRTKVRRFYDHLNRREFERCYRFLDPSLRDSPSSVTQLQYACSLERFLNWCGEVKVIRIDPIQLHLNEPNRQYANRDFAILDVTWKDQAGLEQTFKERWVRDRTGKWYTRRTGLVTPDEP